MYTNIDFHTFACIAHPATRNMKEASVIYLIPQATHIWSEKFKMDPSDIIRGNQIWNAGVDGPKSHQIPAEELEWRFPHIQFSLHFCIFSCIPVLFRKFL